MKLKEMITIALSTAIICILAPIAIPISGYVPISLATLAIMLISVLFGKKIGTYATCLYILLGCIGLPVFASYQSGFGCVLGYTGGFIIGYIPLAWISGAFRDAFRQSKKTKSILLNVLGMIIGTIVLYTVGTAYFEYLLHLPLWSALMSCVFPFLLGDAIKIVIVTVLNERLSKYVH